jgi:hypothetical protein
MFAVLEVFFQQKKEFFVGRPTIKHTRTVFGASPAPSSALVHSDSVSAPNEESVSMSSV